MAREPALLTDTQFYCNQQFTCAIRDGWFKDCPLLTVPGLGLRKSHFMKYSSVEQDHIKHFLPFHTGFGIKCYIECFSIFCYLWPGSKTKSSQADSLCASGPTGTSANAPLCETRFSYRSVPECKKHSQEFKYNTQPPVPPARCVTLPSHA